MALSKKKLLSIALPVILAGVTVLYSTVLRDDAAEFVVEKKTVERGDILSVVTATGTLSPATLVDVGSQATGRIAALHADYNSVVKRGQVMAELDQAPFALRVQQAEAALKMAEAALAKAEVQADHAQGRYDRGATLFTKSLISADERDTMDAAHLDAEAALEKARASFAQARSQVESAKVDLSYTVIRSPLDGVVINRLVNVGQTVVSRATAPVLFQVADDLARLRVECNIRESDIAALRMGQPASFTVHAYPDERFQGVISQVRFASQQVQNVVMYTVVVDVENPELKLMPRMTAAVAIESGSARDALLVPSAALRFVPPSDLAGAIDVHWGEERESEGGPRAAETGPAAEAGRGAGHAGRRSALRNLWVGEADGGIRRVLVRAGLVDQSRTEILEVLTGELKEGDAVVVWATTPETERAARQASGNMGHFGGHVH